MSWISITLLALLYEAYGYRSEVIHFTDIQHVLKQHPETQVLWTSRLESATMSNAVRTLLTSSDARKQVLYFLSNLLWRYERNPEERIINPVIHLRKLYKQDLTALSEEDLTDLFALLFNQDRRMPKAFEEFLLVFGSIHGTFHKNICCETLLAVLEDCNTPLAYACLPNICSHEQFDCLMNAKNAWVFHETALFRFLKYVPVSRAFLEKITNPIFAITPCSLDLREALPGIVKGPNRDLLFSYWRELFMNGFPYGGNIFPFSTLTLILWEETGKDPATEAANLISRSENNADVALGLICFSMVSDDEPTAGPYLESVMEALVSLLRNGDNPAFYAACHLACTLITQGKMDPKRVDDDSVFLALVKNLNRFTGRSHELLLSLVPMNVRRSNLLEKTLLKNLHRHYAKLFKHSLENEFYTTYAEISFAVLCQTGYYRNNIDRIAAFETMVDHIHRFEDECRATDLARIQLLADQVYAVQFNRVPVWVSIASDAVNSLKQIAAEIVSGAVKPFRTEKEVLDVIACLTCRGHNFSYQEAAALLERSVTFRYELDPTTITWFYLLLCIYGLTETALDFYSQNREILLRPFFLPVTVLSNPEEAMAEDSECAIERGHACVGRGVYLNRLMLGLRLAQHNGNSDLCQTFLNKSEITPFIKENPRLSQEESMLIMQLERNIFIGTGNPDLNYDSAIELLYDQSPL